MASEPDWEGIADRVEEMADELGVDLEDFVNFVCRHRQLIRLLLNLCGE